MQKHLVRIFTGVSALAALVTAPCAVSAAQYNITDLGNGFAYAINDNGQIAGSRKIQGLSSPHAVIWNNGGNFTDLGTLPTGDMSIAEGINNLGQAVGDATYDWRYHAVLYKNGTVTDLGTYGGDGYSGANGINDSGQIVGVSSYDHVVLWSGGSWTLTGLSPGYLGQVAINNAGQVAGALNNGAGIWSNGTGTQLPLPSGARGGAANSINDLGHAAGNSSFSNNTVHATLWANGVATDLGTMGAYSSFTRGMNDQGQVVGRLQMTSVSDGPDAAFIYENGVMSDLDTLLVNGDGWHLEEARDINNKGQIVGYGIHNGVVHAYLLNPVPVPPAFWMFGSGLAGLGFLRRRFFSV